MNPIRTIVTIFFIGVTLATNAQQASIRTSIDKNKVLIGQPFTLTIEARIPVSGNLKFPVIDSLPHFEFTGEPEMDTTKEASFLKIIGQYQLLSFDSGHWVIPAIALTRRITSDTLPVDVVFSDFDPKQPYHDIHDIIPVEDAKEDKKIPWWYYVVGGGLLVALILMLVLRRKKVKPALPVLSPDAYQRAKRELAALHQQKPAAKPYYSALTEIFRVYISERKGVRSLQNTTDDLVVQLRSLYMDKAALDTLAQALRLADFVKFAKYVPNAEDDRMAFDAVSRSIDEIERLPDAV